MTPVAKVRLLIAQVADSESIFTDEQLEGYLEIYSGNIFRAAASAIRAIAIDEALMRDVKTDDLQVTGSSTARVLREIADKLDAQADKDEVTDSNDFFEIVYPSQYPVPELHARYYGGF